MSADRKSNPSTAERVGGSVKKAPQHNPDEPDFKTLFHAWLESHRASLVDSVGRLVKQPIGSFFTCLVMAVALTFLELFVAFLQAYIFALLTSVFIGLIRHAH